MKEQNAQSRAYVCKVTNRKARTSASSEYTQVFVEDSDPLLFTATEVANAAKRAQKNPEDIIPVSFVDPCQLPEEKPTETAEKRGLGKLMSFLFRS